MSKAANLLKEICSIPSLLGLQQDLGMSSSELLTAQFVTVRVKIKLLDGCTTPEAHSLLESIREVGWTTDQNRELAELVGSARLQGDAQAARASAGRRAGQKCNNWELYPTDAYWNIVGDPLTPWSAKYRATVSTARSVGLHLPSEPTVGRMLECILLANGMPLGRDKQFYNSLAKLHSELEPLGAEVPTKTRPQTLHRLSVRPRWSRQGNVRLRIP